MAIFTIESEEEIQIDSPKSSNKSYQSSTTNNLSFIHKIKADLGFMKYQYTKYDVKTYETLPKTLSKMISKLKEITASIKTTDTSPITDFLDNFYLPEINPETVLWVIDCILGCRENDMFALFDFLRIAVAQSEQIATAVVTDGWGKLEKSLDRLYGLCDDGKEVSKGIENAQWISTKALWNLFKFSNIFTKLYPSDPEKSLEIPEEAKTPLQNSTTNDFPYYPSKILKIMTHSTLMLPNNVPKITLAATNLMLNIGGKLSSEILKPIEDDPDASYASKLTAVTSKFSPLNRAILSHLLVNTKILNRENVGCEILVHGGLAECRLLHGNFEVVRRMLLEEEGLKARVRLVGGGGSEEVRFVFADLEKILKSYPQRY